jgi:hypothetical protein
MNVSDGGRLVPRLHWFNTRLIEQIRSQAGQPPGAAHSSIYPHASYADLRLAFLIAVALLLVRQLLGTLVIPRLLPRYSATEHGKLTETMFYTLYYLVACGILAILIQSEKWLWKFGNLTSHTSVLDGIFEDWPPSRSGIVHLYYMVTLGFYSSSIVCLFWFDSRRSDFVEFVIHHFVTLGLVLASYFLGFVRCGIALMGLHDLGDVFLYLAKTLHYFGLAGIDTTVFAVFAVTFYCTRLVLLPRISYAIAVDSFRMMAQNATYHNWARNYVSSFRQIALFATLINTLILLHCFWFCLILKMIYRELFLGKKISDEGDIREH